MFKICDNLDALFSLQGKLYEGERNLSFKNRIVCSPKLYQFYFFVAKDLCGTACRMGCFLLCLPFPFRFKFESIFILVIINVYKFL
jgi:hypothetical protein